MPKEGDKVTVRWDGWDAQGEKGAFHGKVLGVDERDGSLKVEIVDSGTHPDTGKPIAQGFVTVKPDDVAQ